MEIPSIEFGRGSVMSPALEKPVGQWTVKFNRNKFKKVLLDKIRRCSISYHKSYNIHYLVPYRFFPKQPSVMARPGENYDVGGNKEIKNSEIIENISQLGTEVTENYENSQV